MSINSDFATGMELADEADRIGTTDPSIPKRREILAKNAKLLITAQATKHFEALFSPLITHFPDTSSVRFAKLALLDAMEAYTEAIKNSDFEAHL